VGATIVLVSPDNSTAPAVIGADGSYIIAKASRGHILVAIQADRPRPSPRAHPNSKAAAMKTRSAVAKVAASLDDEAKMASGGHLQKAIDPAIANFPAHYGDPNKSGLSFELQEPDQEYSPDLK